jgi:hypothetical protein
MATAAFRYCLGRQTYIVGECEKWLIENWQTFPEGVRVCIQRELEEEIKRDDDARARARGEEAFRPLGHDCDRESWMRVRALWKEKE